MKYSFIMPYYNRYNQILKTLESFYKFYYWRDDYEIILLEDIKNYNEINLHHLLKFAVNSYSDIKIKDYPMFDDSFNPAFKYNFGVKEASGEFIILTNPEVMHKVDILKGLDETFSNDKDAYVMCSCESVGYYDKHDMWYQHSLHNNRCLHFCSAISKENYLKIGGFDEEYSKGIAYDDDDFRETIKANNIKIVYRDDLHTVHLLHDVGYQQNKHLWEINRNYFNKKWGK